MRKEIKKAPTMRFRGFTDDWKQRKLNDIADVRDGTHNSPQYQDEGHPFITSKNVKDGFINYAEVEYISDEDFNEINKRSKVAINDILMGMIGTIGNMALIRIEPDFAIKNVALIKDTGQINHLYLYHFLHSPYIKKQLFAVMDGGTQKFISLNNVRNLNILSPKLKEQIELGIYFENLEKFITLYQRKLDQLKKLKKYFLQNMFPAKGEKVPRIRFKGFTDDWEQRKLVDIATMHARIGWQNLRTSEFLDDGDYYLITGTDFKDGRIDFSSCHYVAKERYDQDKNIQIHNGSILITKDGTLGKVAYISGLNKPATLNAGVFNVVIKANDVDEKYLYHYLAGPFLMDYVSKRATGGTIKHLNQNILVDFPVVLPSYDEQKKIGETLQDLDNLITLHQRKLNQLQTMKKFMLQNLFI